MGDRISVQFGTEEKFNCGATYGEKGVVLFHHWGGARFGDEALAYASELLESRKGTRKPLDRFEPNTVMVDFLRHILKDYPVVEDNLYLEKDVNAGDNSDNGNRLIVFNLNTRTVKMIKEE